MKNGSARWGLRGCNENRETLGQTKCGWRLEPETDGFQDDLLPSQPIWVLCGGLKAWHYVCQKGLESSNEIMACRMLLYHWHMPEVLLYKCA